MVALQTIWALCAREIIKFVRDRSRLLGAIVQPLGFWLLLGLGFQGTFRMPMDAAAGVGYIEFLFPGIIALMILFTAIFSTISIVEERQSGFLQAAVTAPTPRTALVVGNALGGTLLSTAQAVLFLLAVPLVGLALHAAGLAFVVLISFITGLSFTALGFTIAWRMETTRGFHAVMNLFLLPLWCLSGAMFPVEGASSGLRWLMVANPVTYGLYGFAEAPATLASPLVCLTVTVGFAAVMMGLAVATVRRPLFED